MSEKNAYACATGPKLIFAYSAALLLGLVPLGGGCGRSDSPATAVAESVSSAALPAPAIPADAAVLSDVHPALASGALRLARLMELPQGVWLQAEGLVLTESDLEQELAQTPRSMRDQLRRNAFFLLEQKVTGDLLRARARKQLGDGPLDDETLFQRYFEHITGGVTVSDAETEAFYAENREMVGGAPLERVQPAIRQHLLQEKQQQAVEQHIREFGRDMPIAVSAAWAREQAALAQDNPLDRARASGIPTFASFGADSCMPCQMMKPFREAIAEKYGERLNVVYVHVNQDQILSSRYGVRGIPHIMFFDAAGREVHARTGFMTQEQIEEWIGKIGVEL